MSTIKKNVVRSKYAPFYDCPDLMREFLNYMLTIRSMSPKTVDAYYNDLKMFYRFRISTSPSSTIDPDMDFDEIPIRDADNALMTTVTLADLYDFMAFTQHERSNSATARARKSSAIKSFYKYITTRTTIMKNNPAESLELPKTKKGLPRYLTLEESVKLLSSDKLHGNSRDYCIVTLFLNCGMRLSELVALNVGDIRGDTLRVIGKGNKERILYLNSACQQAIASYLADTADVERPGGALFLSNRGTRITGRRVQQLVDETLSQAGLDSTGYSPHKLRHTAATLMYQHGAADVRVLQEILGHAQLSTTEIYTHLADTHIKDAMSHSPLAKLQKPTKDSPTEDDE